MLFLKIFFLADLKSPRKMFKIAMPLIHLALQVYQNKKIGMILKTSDSKHQIFFF